MITLSQFKAFEQVRKENHINMHHIIAVAKLSEVLKPSQVKEIISRYEELCKLYR